MNLLYEDKKHYIFLKETLGKRTKDLSWDCYGGLIVDNYSSLLKAD
jgi:hypothetical protein